MRTAALLVLACLSIAVQPPAHAHVAASRFTVAATLAPGMFTLHTRIGADCVAALLYDDGSPGPALAARHVGGTGIVAWPIPARAGVSAAGACVSKGEQQIGLARSSPPRSVPGQADDPLPAGPYPAHHADMLWVAPYRLEVRGDLGSFTAPSAGNEYLVVWTRAANRNDLALSSGDSEFKIVGSDGQVNDANFQSPEPAFGGTIVPGAAMQGSITFEVPKGSHSAQLRWETNPYDAGWPTFTWTLTY